MTRLILFWCIPTTVHLFEPSHEMVLFILCKLILQTRMHSHPVGLDVWFLVDPSSASILHVCEQQKLLRDCAGSPESSLGRLSDEYHNFMRCLFYFCKGNCLKNSDDNITEDELPKNEPSVWASQNSCQSKLSLLYGMMHVVFSYLYIIFKPFPTDIAMVCNSVQLTWLLIRHKKNTHVSTNMPKNIRVGRSEILFIFWQLFIC